MSRFHKRQAVYQLVVGEHDGETRAMVVPVVISAVCPQRDGPHRYHVRSWDGVADMCRLGAVNVPESALFEDLAAAAAAGVAMQEVRQ